MLLYIARHAWAGHYGDPGWADDSLRELSDEGAERFKNVVEALAGRGFEPQRIATSPYARCRQTAEIIARYTPHAPPIDELEALEPGSNLEALLAWSHEYRKQDLCWCGHNPDVAYLAAALVGDGQASVRFAKGSICAIRFAGSPAIEVGELVWHTTAKLLGV